MNNMITKVHADVVMRLRAELAEARRLLDEARKQEPVATHDEIEFSRYCIEWTKGPLPIGTKLYAAPVPAQPAVQTYSGPCMCARDHCQNRTSMPHPSWKCRRESQSTCLPENFIKDVGNES